MPVYALPALRIKAAKQAMELAGRLSNQAFQRKIQGLIRLTRD
jgi:hypothetical protein